MKRIPWLLDVVGSVLVYLVLLRFGIAELAWVAFAPFLVALHRDGSWKHHAWLLAVLVPTLHVVLFKIVTEEVPAIIAPMYAIPVAAALFLSLAVAGAAHRKLGVRWGIYAFPALVVTLSWVQYTFTPGGSWGALAHTQVDNLALVQLASLTGIGGVSFLVALGSSLAAAAITAGVRPIRADLALFAVALTGALVFGELRLAQHAPGPDVRVGAVVSATTFREFRAARHDADAVMRPFDDTLFDRSERAADLGAQVVVWNEVATIVTPASEDALKARGQAFARDREVLLVMAYGLLRSIEPFDWVNKYLLVLPDGAVADEYLKRHPVPGDGDVQGTAHARVIPFAGANVTGAICYDYAFPGIARDNANDGAGIVLLPSSDWKGIDPLHGRMAMMNAVASGLSMVRPVRAATTFVTDPYGRELGALRADPDSPGVMVTTVPSGGVRTLYAQVGEVVPLLALAYCIVVLGGLVTTRRRRVGSIPEAVPTGVAPPVAQVG